MWQKWEVKMLKRIISVMLCLSILTAGASMCSIGVSAYEGVVPEEDTDMAADGLTEVDGVYYYYENGDMVTSRWITAGGYKYYFMKNGNAAVLKCKIGGKYYVFNEKGQLIQPDSKKIVSIKTESGTKKYYVNLDGTARSGWTDDRKYYFYENGEMAAGIILINRKFCCFKANGRYNADKTSKVRKAAKYKKPFTNVKKLIGAPKKSKYYASCYGRGKDGVLSYDGFTVYTYKPDKGKEIFMSVE